jgi:hypothetical protein
MEIIMSLDTSEVITILTIAAVTSVTAITIAVFMTQDKIMLSEEIEVRREEASSRLEVLKKARETQKKKLTAHEKAKEKAVEAWEEKNPAPVVAVAV